MLCHEVKDYVVLWPETYTYDYLTLFFLSRLRPLMHWHDLRRKGRRRNLYRAVRWHPTIVRRPILFNNVGYCRCTILTFIPIFLDLDRSSTDPSRGVWRLRRNLYPTLCWYPTRLYGGRSFFDLDHSCTDSSRGRRAGYVGSSTRLHGPPYQIVRWLPPWWWTQEIKSKADPF